MLTTLILILFSHSFTKPNSKRENHKEKREWGSDYQSGMNCMPGYPCQSRPACMPGYPCPQIEGSFGLLKISQLIINKIIFLNSQ